ncbi:amidohydrolase [Sphingobium nicotianae]|uniref:Amidohydrolase n=1 Tax=Sphingobium nicotianae TaxID=2782607 RepID=A0A9X1D8M5_9SPHN|nr:amidohydrolase [Sphingobium nicotianae]MBT2185884.1 amidohydrolase [Sphingobium nicotianae]
MRLFLAVLLAGFATPAPASGLIDNVNGLTVDATGDLVHFTGLLIDKDGRIEKRLKEGEKRPTLLDYRYDGKGRTLIPGLIDAHGHVMELGFSRLNLDLSDTKSLDEAKAKIAAYAAANPGRPWILGFGWNQEVWGLGRFPTAADLAGLAGGRPIWLERVDGHAGWANDAALAAAKINATTRAPAGGRILMTAGKPSGVLVDEAMGLMSKLVPPPQPKDYDAALQKAQEALLARGVTAIGDMGTDLNGWQAYRRAGDRGALRVRIMSYARGMEQAQIIAGPGPTPWLYDDRLRMGGVKLYMDGALGSRGAWLKAPYADAPTETGLPRMTSASLRNQMSRAAMDGFQIAVHAIGDKANAEVLDAIDELSATYQGDRRWRIEHAQIVDPLDLPRFALHGTIASMQPQHESSDWQMAIARLGPTRLGGAYAWKAMLANKVPLAFGSDVPVEPADPFIGLKSAITRTDAKDQPPGGWLPEQRISLAEALRAYTWGAAYAGFAEQRFGNLAPGQRADFLILDREIELARPADLPATQIVEVWIGGQRVLSK